MVRASIDGVYGAASSRGALGAATETSAKSTRGRAPAVRSDSGLTTGRLSDFGMDSLRARTSASSSWTVRSAVHRAASLPTGAATVAWAWPWGRTASGRGLEGLAADRGLGRRLLARKNGPPLWVARRAAGRAAGRTGGRTGSPDAIESRSSQHPRALNLARGPTQGRSSEILQKQYKTEVRKETTTQAPLLT